MTSADKALVTLYLVQIKNLITAGRIHFRDRGKNLATLALLGITHQHRIGVLQRLLPSNYCYTVEPELGTEEAGWVFGTVDQGIEIYIKLKIVEDPSSGDLAICVSFHQADRPLTYPYVR